MTCARSLIGMLLVMSTALALAQEPTCDPCVDGPEAFGNPVRLDFDTVPSSASQIASRIREFGGRLRDITHDCGISRNTRYAEIDFSVRACSWGGRYPALLLEPIGADSTAATSVLLASNGEVLEVLFDGDAPAALVESFSGLLKEDFDEMFQELRDPADG